jgi:SAM-dependent methyltransferase
MGHQERWQLAGNAAEAYERYLVPAIFEGWARRLVELAALRPGERALDVACGTGIVARLAAQRAGSGRVVGFDLNPGMLAFARSLPHTPGAVVEWREGDALALPFPDASFEAALCQNGLQYFPDRLAALREMHRVLVPSGRLALLVWGAIERSPGFASLASALAQHVSAEAAAIMRAPFAISDAGILRTLVAETGFRDVVVLNEVGTARFPSIEGFVQRQVAGSPLREPVGAADDTARAAVVAEVSSTLRAYATPVGLAFPMEAHLITAGKESAG